MAKVLTQEEREKIKGQIVDLVRQSGRETLRQLEAKTGATRYLIGHASVNQHGNITGVFVCQKWKGDAGGVIRMLC